MEYSYGPKITQAVPRAQRTPVIPTEYGLPVMSMDSAFSTMDPRIHDVPAMGMNDADDSVPASEVEAKVSEAPGGRYAAAAKHDKDYAVHTGFESPEEAGKWAGTMKRKIARQSIHGHGKEAFQRHVAEEPELNIPPDEHSEDSMATDCSTCGHSPCRC